MQRILCSICFGNFQELFTSSICVHSFRPTNNSEGMDVKRRGETFILAFKLWIHPFHPYMYIVGPLNEKRKKKNFFRMLRHIIFTGENCNNFYHEMLVSAPMSYPICIAAVYFQIFFSYFACRLSCVVNANTIFKFLVAFSITNSLFVCCVLDLWLVKFIFFSSSSSS